MIGGAAVTNISLNKFLQRVGNKFAAFIEVARRVPGGGWAWDQ